MANRATVTYNNKTISTEDRDGDFAITYNGSTIATIGAGTTKTLNCSGKLMTTNVVIGGKTLNCAKYKMATNVVVSVVSLFPSEPSSYNLIAKYTSSQTWTAPEDGYYQVEVFGASGNGGTGFWQALFGSYGSRASGGGGGGGAYCCSNKIKMNKGDTIVLTIGAVGAITSATFNSSLETYTAMQATSGGNGGAASTSGAGTGGTGGTASGGNVSNKNGGAGAAGTKNSMTNTAVLGGAGGAAGYTGGNAGGAGSNVAADGTISTAGAGKKGFIKIYRGDTNLSGGNTSNNPVFYLQTLDGTVTREFEFEEGMLWSDFVASEYNNGLFTMDDSTELQVTWTTTYTGIIKDCLGYNGFHVDPIGDSSNGIYAITESTGNDSLEAGKTYYCNGVV